VRQILAHEQDKIGSLPHPGFVSDMLAEARDALPRDRLRAAVALEEVVEYLDALLLEMRSLDLTDESAFPRSPIEQRRNQLYKRMEQWERKNLSSELRDYRLECAGLNPIYRDLVVFLWATSASCDVQKEVSRCERRSRSVDLRSLWF